MFAADNQQVVPHRVAPQLACLHLIAPHLVDGAARNAPGNSESATTVSRKANIRLYLCLNMALVFGQGVPAPKYTNRAL